MTNPWLHSRPAAGLLLALALLPVGCSVFESKPKTIEDKIAAAELDDFLVRLAQRLESPQREEPAALMFRLERLLPAWQSEQRDGNEAPLEAVLTQDVVAHFDIVLYEFERGVRDRRLVSAWALGFSRVPENDLGIRSPHPRAVAALIAAVPAADDEMMRNIMLGLWKIGDEDTPLQPIIDVATRHHDPEARGNATLALSSIITSRTNEAVVDAILAALTDADARVRMHAASTARRHPHAAYTSRIESLITSEHTPLVRASMAAALGRSGNTAAAPLLLPMLNSTYPVEQLSARQALTDLFGEDHGPRPEDWVHLID